jgi:NTE family protein
MEIDGEYYWDGGLMSNTPLYEVVQSTPRRDTLAFQVDLWSAIGPVPDSILRRAGPHEGHSVFEPHASRYRHAATLAALPACAARGARPCGAGTSATDPGARSPDELSCSKRYNVVHLIYRQKEYEGHFKDFQFGLSTMREHWESGLEDIRALSGATRLARNARKRRGLRHARYSPRQTLG